MSASSWLEGIQESLYVYQRRCGKRQPSHCGERVWTVVGAQPAAHAHSQEQARAPVPRVARHYQTMKHRTRR